MLKDIKDKNILIAGANGIIGSFLSNQMKDNFNILNLGFKRKSEHTNYYALDLIKSREVSNFVKHIEKIHALVFLVGLAHKKGEGKEINKFRDINKNTLVNLILSLKDKNNFPEKIIFASTISVYGERLNQSLYFEDSIKKPLSPYAISKLEAEEFLLKYFNKKTWILRLAPVYSNHFRLNIDRRTIFKNWFYKVGDGEKKISLCNMQNIGAVVQGVLNNRIPSGIYNVSDPIEYSYKDLLKYNKAEKIIPIPHLILKLILFIATFFNNIYIVENTIKLISDNVYPSHKLRKYIKLNFSIYK